MNKFIQKFSHPALFGFLIAGAILIGGSMFGGGSIVPTAHAWFCNGNTSSSPCGTVTTIVNVVNTGGGTAKPSNFTVSLYGSLDPATTTFKGSASGTVENIDPENYQVTVSPKTDYDFTYSSDCSGTLNAGDSKTCTVTATYCPPTVTPPSADISISKTADVTSTESGDTMNYTVTVTDNGPATSTGVVATDTLPSGMTFVSATTSQGSYSSSTGSWNVGTLSNGQSATLTIAATANTVTASTTVTNTATVAESASETDPNTANNIASVSICVEPCPPTTPTSTPTSSTPIANLSITKTVDNASPAAGDTVNYTLTVDALGPATSTGVVATDTLPSGLTFENATASVGSYATSTGTWTIGDMSPSSTATLNIAALVDASDTASQAITNFATVGETPSSTNQTGNSSSSVTVTVQGGGGCGSNCGGGGTGNDAELSITKTANVSSTLPGDVIDYTITATAGGPQPSTGVVATDTLPSGLTFENATASVGSYATSTGTWTIGTLAPNATATLQIAALVNATGTAGTTITNTATIGESTSLTNTGGNTTSQVSVSVGTNGGGSSDVADLAINKTVDNASPVTGTDVNFTVVVTNNGPDAAPDVVAMDPLPIGLATVSATTTASTTFDMANGLWTIGTLAPNATATLSLEAEVSAAGGTQVVNTATVSSTLSSLVDPNPANNSSSVTLNVQSSGGGGGCGSNCGGGGNTPSAQLAIVKTVDNSDPATGAVIHYTLTVSGEGPSESFGVVASDTLPAGITFDSATSSEGSYNSSTGIWTIGDIADGQSQTLVITATVTAPNGTSITNTGTVSESSAATSPLTGPMTSSVTITVGGSGGNGGGGGGNGGGGGGGGQVLGASTSTGQVLGASCGLYLTSYIHPIRQDLNDPTEVKKLQVFLNQNLGLNLAVNGIYNAATIAAVNQFQVKYHTEVLQPWVSLGLPTQFTPTSYVYQSTERWINLIMCPPLNLPLPALKVDTGE